MFNVSRAHLARTHLVLACVGPIAGAVALFYGEIPLWSAPHPGIAAPGARSGIWLGTWPTLACVGLLLAAPVRLWAGLAARRDDRGGWIALAAAAVVGCADLSIGPALALLTARVWAREGPAVLIEQTPP